jgi:hypothetical protein
VHVLPLTNIYYACLLLPLALFCPFPRIRRSPRFVQCNVSLFHCCFIYSVLLVILVMSTATACFALQQGPPSTYVDGTVDNYVWPAWFSDEPPVNLEAWEVICHAEGSMPYMGVPLPVTLFHVGPPADFSSVFSARPGWMCNGETITSFMAHLFCRDNDTHDDDKDRSLFLSTTVVSDNYSNERVVEYADRFVLELSVNLYDWIRVFIPVHVGGNHWVLVVVNKLSEDTHPGYAYNAVIYDSWLKGNYDKTVLAFMVKSIFVSAVAAKDKTLSVQFEILELPEADLPQQLPGTVDCGFMVCAYADALSSSPALAVLEIDPRQCGAIRYRVAMTLMSGRALTAANTAPSRITPLFLRKLKGCKSSGYVPLPRADSGGNKSVSTFNTLK